MCIYKYFSNGCIHSSNIDYKNINWLNVIFFTRLILQRMYFSMSMFAIITLYNFTNTKGISCLLVYNKYMVINATVTFVQKG